MCVVEVDHFHSISEWDHPRRLNHPDNHCYYSIQAYINTGHDDDDENDVSEQQTATVLRSNTECPVVVLVLKLCNLLLALVVMISLSSVQFLILWYNSHQQFAAEAVVAQQQLQRVERTSIMSNEWQRLGRL